MLIDTWTHTIGLAEAIALGCYPVGAIPAIHLEPHNLFRNMLSEIPEENLSKLYFADDKESTMITRKLSIFLVSLFFVTMVKKESEYYPGAIIAAQRNLISKSANSAQVVGPVDAPAEKVTAGKVIRSARIAGDPIYFESLGDSWMTTWAANDKLYVSWGDGTGFGLCYPAQHPILDISPKNLTSCSIPETHSLFCGLFCKINPCGASDLYPPCPLTAAGLLAFGGPVPSFTAVDNLAIHVPTGIPLFQKGVDTSGLRNDKPGSLLAYHGRLYWSGHYHIFGNPVKTPNDPSTDYGYIAYSDDGGVSWVEIGNSPWIPGNQSNFRVRMFINMGRDYELNIDGYVYALAKDFGAWGFLSGFDPIKHADKLSVYLTRVPKDRFIDGVGKEVDPILDYGAYEYFAGLDGKQEPVWSSQQSKGVALSGLQTANLGSAMYHEGTGRYLFLAAGPGAPDALFEAPYPWGPWTRVTKLFFDADPDGYNPKWADGQYLPGLITKGAGPNHVYFTTAGGDKHYQLQIGKIELEIEEEFLFLYLPITRMDL